MKSLTRTVGSQCVFWMSLLSAWSLALCAAGAWTAGPAGTWLFGTAAILSAALGLGAIRAAGTGVGRPIAEITETLRKVLGYESVEVPHADRADEIGEIARLLQGSQAETARWLASEDQRQRESQAALDRAARIAELQTRFASVIGAAVDGDLTGRVDARFGDPELDALGNRVDELLVTIESGLSETRAVLGQLASGKLGARVRGQYRGAFAELKHGTNALGDAFEETLSQLTHASVAVRTATAEIFAGATDLAARTSDQASVVQSATAQLMTFAEAVRENARHADSAVELARRAETGAREGSDVMRSASEAMQAIAQSSRKISDIINLIDEIAFQTNLLALNAAVEAARAGDSGRGFAVVAAEVRSLAQRAAGASNDIKQLIVAAQSAVQSGVSLVDRTSSSLEGIFGSIEDVHTLMEAIAEASRQQSEEIGRLNEEVSRIDELTQQNAALVEQTNAALGVTDQHTAALEGLVSRFQFAGSGRPDSGSSRVAA